MIAKVKFARSAGSDIHEKFEDQIKIVLDALLDAEMDEKKRKIDAHDAIELSRFLKILGPQVIQITLIHDSHSPVSYVIKTTDKDVEYVKAISGKQDDATIDIDIDLNSVMDPANGNLSPNPKDTFVSLVKQVRTPGMIWNVFKLFAAVTVDYGNSYVKGRARK